MKSRFRVGTRGSKLALTQTQQTLEALQKLHPGVAFETVVIKTTGDKITDVALSRIGDKGLFVKEIEQALLDGDVDLAIHSMKDMPTELPPGLTIGCVPERLPSNDAIIVSDSLPDVCHTGVLLKTLPIKATIGTGSLRRRAQLGRWRNDLQFAELRGNLTTRLARLHEGGFDATVLAVAGLMRLGTLQHEVSAIGAGGSWMALEGGFHAWGVPLAFCVPAVGQGALCVEQREGDEDVRQLLEPLSHISSQYEVETERRFLANIQGGCQIPAGASAHVQRDQIFLTAILCSLDGSKVYARSGTGPISERFRIADEIACKVLEAGGQAVLDAIRSTGQSSRQPELT
ncbi:MAG: hydroxymethylbilane synthase [Candidatus Xenobia bacterium]